MAGQQIDHHARMRRIEMLDQDEGYAGAAREDRKQPAERVEPTRRRAEPNNRETVIPERRAVPRRWPPARPRASRSGLSRILPPHGDARSIGISRRYSSETDMR
jgi:hypothetical protein